MKIIIRLLLPWFLVPGAQAATLPTNVLLLFADGAGMAHLATADQYKRHLEGKGLYLTTRLAPAAETGFLATESADSLVTDSAAAATAMATGVKTRNYAVGVDAHGLPVDSVTEVAKRRGKVVALASDDLMTDASPAAFGGAHFAKRGNHEAIAARYLEVGIDLLVGGGRDYFLPERQGGARKDDRDLAADFRQRGYAWTTTLEALAAAPPGAALALLAPRELPLETDRKGEPAFPDLTEGVLRRLEGETRGFFAFIESEQIDSAAHAADVVNMLKAVVAFDQAVAVADAFRRRHPGTLLLVASDHETGAFGATPTLRELPDAEGKSLFSPATDRFAKLAGISLSTSEAARLLGKRPQPDAVRALVGKHFPGFTLDGDLLEKMVRGERPSRTRQYGIMNLLGEMVARETGLSWGSSGHTNGWTFVFAAGPGAERFRGVLDNDAFGRRLKGVLAEEAPP